MNLKLIVVLGASLGFCLGLGLGLLANSKGPGLVLKACFCALAMAAILRWWGKIVGKFVEKAIEQIQNTDQSNISA